MEKSEWILAPREPTPEMIRATHGVPSSPGARNIAGIYRAMLAAAPEAATPSAEFVAPVPPSHWNKGQGKYSSSLCFEGGVLLINIAGYDDRDGNGQIALHEEAVREDGEGYMCVGLPNSELIAIRDNLIKWFPPEIERVTRPADGTELPHKDGWRILRSIDPDGPAPKLLWERVPVAPDKAPSAVGGVDRMREALRQIVAGAKSGDQIFQERLGERKAPTWYAVNGLQDHLACCGGNAEIALEESAQPSAGGQS